MSILRVARLGHPVLRQRARPLDRGEVKSAAIQKLIDDLIETMGDYHGVGLAAPQVHEGVRLFVAALDHMDGVAAGGETGTAVFINPEVTRVGEDEVEDWEGCLSIPDLRGRVPRARAIVIRALDRHGARVEIQAREFAARVMQHEYDHLDGVLFLDRMRSLDSLTFLEEFSRYWVKD